MKKIVSNNLSAKKFFSKKRTMAAAMSTLSVSVTLGAGVSQIILSQSKYVYNGQTFDSYKDLSKYVKSNSIVKNVEKNSNWTITTNGSTKTYTDPETLRNDIYNNYITSTTNIASKNSTTFSTKNMGSTLRDSSSVTTAYKGYKGVAYDSKDAAYSSFFNPKSGYYFNNIYFENKSDLNNYLLTNYFPSRSSTSSNNTIILKSPSGVESQPINLSSTSAYSEIDSFIKNYANSSLSYTNSKTKQSFNINSSNVDDVASSVSLSDLDYIHTHSNQGESRYIIDNDSVDSGNIIGPYFYNGVLDTGAFTNKSMWKKVNNVKSQVYSQSKIDISIGSFFSSIINDDAALNTTQAENSNSTPLLFRTLLSTDEGNSYDEWFLEQLGNLSPKLKVAVTEANATMMQGKKYNTFYKITVLYNFLLSRIVSWGLSQEVLDLVVNYFSNVTNFIQEAIEFVALYNPELLKSKDGKTSFNAKTFFQIGNPEYDYNTSSEYFLNQLKENYPNLVALMTTYVSAENNITMTGGLIPFYAIDNSSLISLGIISEESYTSIVDKLEAVYNVFSSLNTSDMLTLYVKNSGRSDIKALSSLSGTALSTAFANLKTNFGNISLETMLSGIGAKNSQYYQLASSVLKTEIRVYLSTGAITKGGYLWQLYSKDPNYDKLGLFVNFVSDNPTLAENSLYRIYLAFMIDKRQANNQFFTNVTTKTWTAFAHSLSQLILFSLGSAGLTANTINKLYKSYSTNNSSFAAIPSPTKNPVLNLFDASSRESIASATFSTTTHGLTTNGNDDKYVLNTRKASSSGSLVQASSSTRSSLFLSDVSSTSGIPEKSIYFASLDDFLKNKFTEKAPTFAGKVQTSLSTQAIIRTTDGSLSIMNPFDDATASSANNFNQLPDLEKQWSMTSSIGDGTVEYKRPSIENFKTEKKSWWSGSFSSFNKLKDVISTIANFALSAFAAAFTALELFFFMYNLFSETTTQDFYVYTTTDGTEFIWDGGRTVSKFLGLSVNQTVGINDMMLLNPVQITLPQVEEFYYFNGVKYYDNTENLKKDQLVYMLNGGKVRNTNFKSYYTFDNNANGDKGSTLEELLQKVISNLGITKKDDGSFNYGNLNKNSTYISSTSTTIYGLTSTSSSDNYTTISKTISENIRPTWIVKLPDLKNGVATGTITDDGTKFPGNYWDGSKVVTQTSVKNFLVDNSANNIKNASLSYSDKSNFENTDATKATNESKTTLYKTFTSSFSLATKKVWKNELNNKDLYDNISEVETQSVYLVNIFGTKQAFSSLESATNYVLKKLNFTKNASYSKVYIYDGTTFNSESELMKYVLQNCEK